MRVRSRSMAGSRARAGLLGAAAAVVVVGCGPSELKGSLSENIDLHYTEVRAAAAGSQQTLRFTTPQGNGVNIIFEVAAELSGISGYAPGTVVDLAELGPDGAQRGRVSRNVFEEARQGFPDLLRGHLTFNQWIEEPDVPHEPGRVISGDFSVTFIECTVFACGRTVYGTFEAIVP